MEDKKKYIKRNIKNISKAVLGSTQMFAGVITTAFIPIVGIPITIDGAQRAVKGIRGEYIKDSMINVISSKSYSKAFHKGENRIIQEFPNPKQFIAASMLKDKTTFLLMQELNFLLGSDTFDKKGERITYSTLSQGLTRFMLRRLEKAGMIQDFKSEDAKPKALVLEKMMLGNINKKMFRKDKMYEMSFAKTDKEITEDDIKKFLKIEELDENKYDIKRDKDGNIQSINYKAIPIIKNSLNKVKEKYLPIKDKTLMLEEGKIQENEKVKESKESFLENLKDKVNIIEETLDDKTTNSEITEYKIDLER